MAVYQYEEILSMYTKMIPFSRYDVLLYELGRLMLTDIKPDTHVLNKNYRSYNTYRKDISPDSSSLKINETYNNQDNIEGSYYEIKPADTSYVFDGIVLSKKFATNGNEMSLEDLFSEFYYDYLSAEDSSYLYSPNFGDTYYFNQSSIDPDTQEEIIGGTYEILPEGSIYIDENMESTRIEYDGTYVPTIGELLSGTLYIVIQSQGKPPRKIFFNNTQLPTLFINDDKYFTTDEYIMNDNQLMKLCDVKLYSKLGCRIGWEKISYINGLSLRDMLINIDDEENTLKDENGNITPDKVFFKIYYRAEYTNSVNPGNPISFITGRSYIYYFWNPDIGEWTNSDFDFSSGAVDNPRNSDNLQAWIWRDGVPTDYNYNDMYYLEDSDKAFHGSMTGYIPASNKLEHVIKVDIWLGMSMILKGYSLDEPDPDTYNLQWYSYSEDTPQPTDGTLEFKIINNRETNSANITHIKIYFANTNYTIDQNITIPVGQEVSGTTNIQVAYQNIQLTVSNIEITASDESSRPYYWNQSPISYTWSSQSSQPLIITLIPSSTVIKYNIVNNTSVSIQACGAGFKNTADPTEMFQLTGGGGIQPNTSHGPLEKTLKGNQLNKTWELITDDTQWNGAYISNINSQKLSSFSPTVSIKLNRMPYRFPVNYNTTVEINIIYEQ